MLKSRDSRRLRRGSKKHFFMFLSLLSEHPGGIYMELEWIRTDGEVGVWGNHLLNPREHRHIRAVRLMSSPCALFVIV